MSNFAAAAVVSIDDPERVTVNPQRDTVRVLVTTSRTAGDAAVIYLSHEAARDLVGKLTDALAVTS